MEIEVASQISLKAQKRCIKTLVIWIISLKTTNIYIYFFNNSGDRIWQPLLVSSQPILDFLEPCCCLTVVSGPECAYMDSIKNSGNI